MPGNDEKFIAGEEIPNHIRIGKNGADHQRPRDDAAAVHRVRGKHILASKDGFPDQCAGDAMSDCVHLCLRVRCTGTMMPWFRWNWMMIFGSRNRKQAEEDMSELQSPDHRLCCLLLDLVTSFGTMIWSPLQWS